MMPKMDRGRRRKKRTEAEIAADAAIDKEKSLSNWIPKTELGKKVKNGEITSISEVFEKNLPILEPEIVDSLLALEDITVDIKKTARVVRAGRKFSFRVSVLVGNKNGIVGLGTATDRERWAAEKKAAKMARMRLVHVKRGCGSWECTCGAEHSVPFKVEGGCGSVKVTLLPAPRGIGLVIGDNVKDVLKLAGVNDVWSKIKGATDTRLNFVAATIDALAQTSKMKVSNDIARKFEKGGK